MYQLILSICLIAAPADCKEEEFFNPLSMWECMVGGQAYADIWLRQHPGWELKSFKCRQAAQSKARS